MNAHTAQYLRTITPKEMSASEKIAALMDERAELSALDPAALVSVPNNAPIPRNQTITARERIAQIDAGMRRIQEGE